jgi:8-oxo-dGTP pyrophosphatase MutT (NUDIX family)
MVDEAVNKQTVVDKPRYATLTVFYLSTVTASQIPPPRLEGEVVDLNDDSAVKTEAEHELLVVVCRRGVGGQDYGQIYSCGGAIDRKETPEEAACREGWEESGIRVDPNQLQRFYPRTSDPKMAHFYVLLDDRPDIHGATDRHAWEVLYERSILDYPTTKSWATIPIHDLAEHFYQNKSSTSAFSRLFLDMYENLLTTQYPKKEKSD